MTARKGMSIAEYRKAEQALHDAHIAAGSPDVGFIRCPNLWLGEVIGGEPWPQDDAVECENLLDAQLNHETPKAVL